MVLCTWETIIASSELQLLWEGYFFVFLCASCISLIQVCAKNQEMAENLVFGALPLVLGVPNFPKLVYLVQHTPNFLTHLIRISCLLFKDSFVKVPFCNTFPTNKKIESSKQF